MITQAINNTKKNTGERQNENNEELAKEIPTVTPDEDNLEPVPVPEVEEEH